MGHSNLPFLHGLSVVLSASALAGATIASTVASDPSATETANPLTPLGVGDVNVQTRLGVREEGTFCLRTPVVTAAERTRRATGKASIAVHVGRSALSMPRSGSFVHHSDKTGIDWDLQSVSSL
jgi:hypothetical protein